MTYISIVIIEIVNVGMRFLKESNRNQINLILDQMNKSQIHRGPNSTNSYINSSNQVGLVMCRLSILDLELGIQPMTSKMGDTPLYLMELF